MPFIAIGKINIAEGRDGAFHEVLIWFEGNSRYTINFRKV